MNHPQEIKKPRSVRAVFALLLCTVTLLLQSGCAFELEGNERDFFTGNFSHAEKPGQAPPPAAPKLVVTK
jgi:hypothetical protein